MFCGASARWEHLLVLSQRWTCGSSGGLDQVSSPHRALAERTCSLRRAAGSCGGKLRGGRDGVGLQWPCTPLRVPLNLHNVVSVHCSSFNRRVVLLYCLSPAATQPRNACDECFLWWERAVWLLLSEAGLSTARASTSCRRFGGFTEGQKRCGKLHLSSLHPCCFFLTAPRWLVVRRRAAAAVQAFGFPAFDGSDVSLSSWLSSSHEAFTSISVSCLYISSADWRSLVSFIAFCRRPFRLQIWKATVSQVSPSNNLLKAKVESLLLFDSCSSGVHAVRWMSFAMIS